MLLVFMLLMLNLQKQLVMMQQAARRTRPRRARGEEALARGRRSLSRRRRVGRDVRAS